MKILINWLVAILLIGVPVVIGCSVGANVASWYERASVKPVAWIVGALMLWCTGAWPIWIVALLQPPDRLELDPLIHIVVVAVICAVVPAVPHNGWGYAAMAAQYWGIIYLGCAIDQRE